MISKSVAETVNISIDDPRMVKPQCRSLQPVSTEHINPWFSLKNRGGYYTLEYHQPQVAILPVVDNHSIVMVRVKRPVLDDTPLELPAGAADLNETPAQTAARELKEETGIQIDRIDRFNLLTSIAISPNRYPVLPWIYQIDISQNEFDTRKQHDEEITSVECLKYEEVRNNILSGGIYISLVIAIVSRFLFSINDIPDDK
jgi:8-oxo-dGTP pyrophosphatase MutT (NUDIX family)